ncbi:MAG: hypothetical protein O2844_01285 [Proteobacteria bacterium]|nr:hypothetical protein [Pseudomonadota bacterium]MDA1187017.1 hypothetical protein [Pseudomonadota bacterium]
MKKTTVAQALSVLLFFSSSSVFSQVRDSNAANKAPSAGVGVTNSTPFASTWLTLPSNTNPEGIDTPTADSIVIPQVDTSSGQSDNKVELKIKNSNITVIAPAGDSTSSNLLQSGSGNTADITVNGPENTVLFTQLGNSTLTMTITNTTAGNKVVFNEFGGISTAEKATVDLVLNGDNNQIQAAAIVAGVALNVAVDLDLNITGSDNVIALGYDDFSTIALTIAGNMTASNEVSISQENEQTATGSTDGNTATISLNNRSGATLGYEVLLRQNGIKNAVVVTLDSGDNGSVQIYQDGNTNKFTFTSTQASGDTTSPVVDLDAVTEGSNNIITITAAEGDEASQGVRGTNFGVSVRGDTNNVDLEGASSLQLRIYGNTNKIESDASSTYFQTSSGGSSALVIDLFGDSNELYYKDVLVSSLDLGIDTSSNKVYLGRSADASNLTTGLSAASSTFDIDIGGGNGNILSILGNDAGGAGTVNVDISGARNTVAMVYGGHNLTYAVTGSDFNTQVTYDGVRDNYSHTITTLGEGSVVLASIDGTSCVFNSSTGGLAPPTNFCGTP